MKNFLNKFILMSGLLMLVACLDKDVSTLYYYKGIFICEGELASSVDRLSKCFDRKSFNSVVFKPETGASDKVISRTMNLISAKNMDRVKLINFIREEEKDNLEKILVANPSVSKAD